MISDARLIGLFSGYNRNYVLTWDNGEVAYFRARNMRDARKIANEFTNRLVSQGETVTLIGVERV